MTTGGALWTQHSNAPAEYAIKREEADLCEVASALNFPDVALLTLNNIRQIGHASNPLNESLLYGLYPSNLVL